MGRYLTLVRTSPDQVQELVRTSQAEAGRRRDRPCAGEALVHRESPRVRALPVAGLHVDQVGHQLTAVMRQRLADQPPSVPATP